MLANKTNRIAASILGICGLTVVAMLSSPVPTANAQGVTPPTTPSATISASYNNGTDALCALHADVIAGLTCLNQVTDGTTQQAFVTALTIPANYLTPGQLLRVTMPVGTYSPNPSELVNLFEVYLDGLAGTRIYRATGGTPTASSANNLQMLTCEMYAVTALSTTATVAVACWGQSLFARSNLPGQFTVNTTIPHTFNLTAQYASTPTAGNALQLWGMFPTPSPIK